MDFLKPKAYFIASDSPHESWIILTPKQQGGTRYGRISKSVLLLVSGAVLFGLVLPVTFYNVISSQGTAALLDTAAASAADASLATFSLPRIEPTAPAEELRGTFTEIPAVVENRFVPAVSAAATAPLLRIDAIGVLMPIVEGEGEDALWKGAWRSPWGSTPDKGGNTVLFGHRFLHLPPSKNTLFRLDEIELGDTFEVDWQGETLTYKVSEIKIVEPSDLSVLKQTTEPTITLITCTPKFTTKQRLIVSAIQI